MVLESLGATGHNAMVRGRTPHPASTKYHDDDLPPAKRLKTSESTNRENSKSENERILQGPGLQKHEIPESEDDDDGSGGEEPSRPQRPTELESVLPPVKTDKGAIDEYEAMRAAEEVPQDLKSRITQRSWVQGKSSIYVDAFNLALETVLDDESHLFDEKEMEVFRQWRELRYEAQYLYVRLFLRKTSAWHRIKKLGYHGDIADLQEAVNILQSVRALPESSAAPQENPAEVAPPKGTLLDSSFSFADSSDGLITTLEEASSLLNLEEIKVLAKEAKVQGKNKAGLLKSLLQMSERQRGLGWVGLKRSDSQHSVASESGNDDDSDSMLDINRDSHFLRKIMSTTGPCVRLSLPTLKLFERVHLVFYRSTEWTDKSLTTIILARISRRNFPDYIVSRSQNIFASRSDLLEFEASLRTQFRVDNILELNGNPSKGALEEVLSIFDEVYPRWKVLLKEEQRKEDRIYESGEGAYLRRFSPAWVYTRIVHKGTYALGRFKMHEREHEVTSDLLNQHLFHAARRGAWYQRKALLEEHYMHSLQPPPGISDLEQQKKYWKKISLRTCEAGLQDKDCHMIYHYDLQKRIRKLEKNLKIPKREQHDFGHVLLSKPVEVIVEGTQIKKEYPPSKRRASATGDEKQRSTKTTWVDEAEGGGECSVEAMCLSDYRSRGFKGYHAEGGIVRTLFAYLFYDVIFVYVPNVFQTAYQTCPLDLHTDAFFPARASEINHRLVEIENGSAADIIRAVDAREREKRTCVIGLNWDFELQDLLEIVSCFDGHALAIICKVMAQEYRVRGGGMPDLFLWDVKEKKVMFSEVKSENDRLSDTQRLWIHVLTGAGLRVELCNAVAKEVKIISID
ncbi:coiled-coil domain-containing protein MTMR15 [Drepanopeziza brunnea f. sp. 'multigermtubi' MB_m1]|uniref:Fanconi-associated nuclease n=1 Tax=Marssonina brunnea f. sp. multigermtubi (strain MB_m1) TaxID=1072389 RepID=K1WSW5_MARBU|nr:coiled-coil domain-containing protein MTMR15 [Drepanopeziza brunnea f. sp. 'multigermtubi' MB_m1]EKD20730.1 coiled-coil domain-containing protein MTMR15 [Drepanopeziza brunnea f. sp. 'multigermtubi' MB_m1]